MREERGDLPCRHQPAFQPRNLLLREDTGSTVSCATGVKRPNVQMKQRRAFGRQRQRRRLLASGLAKASGSVGTGPAVEGAGEAALVLVRATAQHRAGLVAAYDRYMSCGSRCFLESGSHTQLLSKMCFISSSNRSSLAKISRRQRNTPASCRPARRWRADDRVSGLIDKRGHGISPANSTPTGASLATMSMTTVEFGVAARKGRPIAARYAAARLRCSLLWLSTPSTRAVRWMSNWISANGPLRSLALMLASSARSVRAGTRPSRVA